MKVGSLSAFLTGVSWAPEKINVRCVTLPDHVFRKYSVLYKRQTGRGELVQKIL